MNDPAKLWKCDRCGNLDMQCRIMWCLVFAHLRDLKKEHCLLLSFLALGKIDLMKAELCSDH